MDPNAALEEIRDRIIEAREAADGDSNDAEIEAWQRVGEHAEALDEWLSKGGFLPKAWVTVAVPSRRLDVSPMIAMHVLHELDNTAYPAAGSFIAALINAIALADRPNRELLGQGFPGYVAAVATFKDDMDGLTWLRMKANQG